MHQFTPTIELGCLREFFKIARGGDFSTTKVLEATTHGTWFVGCAATKLLGDKEAPENEDRGLLDRLFGSEGPQPIDPVNWSDDELLNALEQYVPSEDDTYGAIPWDSILQFVIPIILEWLRRRA